MDLYGGFGRNVLADKSSKRQDTDRTRYREFKSLPGFRRLVFVTPLSKPLQTLTIKNTYIFFYIRSRILPETFVKFEKMSRFSDTSLEARWRFFAKDGFGLALKPGITLPTGKYEDEFGSGRVTYGITFIASKELEPFDFHFNAGYAVKGLNLVGNIGLERNPDPERGTMPAFALVGFNYAITDFMVIDAGFKVGLNKQEVDNAFIGGLTFTF